MPRLEDYLVLNRYMHRLLGAQDFEDLKNLLRLMPEGPDGSGQSHFFGRLATQPDLRIPRDRLEEYDRRVMAYEDRLRKVRRDFRGFRYFQYLALLYTEIFLDHLTEDSRSLAADLNVFLDELRAKEPELAEFPGWKPEDLRRLAFFMATGSGKTLLMHVNIWQLLHYLEFGRHPEALAPGNAPRREFDNILLITPNEGLSAQHLAELRQSGFDAALFVQDRGGCTSFFGPRVNVIEIHKLAEEASGEGVSVPLEALGQNNLVIVDEGHKGTGSEAQAWKRRQKYLSEGGFLLEYSATFAQAIAGAGKKAQKELLREYGRAILFDYSYAHFYGDGYGKDFTVLNLRDSHPDQAHELLVGGLLVFYHQLYLYKQNLSSYRPYNIEKPLWVLLGSSVNALYTQDKERRSDVAEVVAFLKRFVEDREWTIPVIRRMLAGESGFQDVESGQDLFAPYLGHLRGQDAESLYGSILAEVFRGNGGLEVWEIKQADGEFGLRLSTADEDAPYFGVINIGDVSAFKKYLAEHLSIEVHEDNFRPSQFDLVDHPDSPIYLLIGAKKFIEGWSSWRVSSMGLLNVGKGAGSQIIQLFGRGVRLKGKDMSLKRSSALQDETPPEDIRFLETLTIFGWNADYMETFRNIIENEGLPKEFVLKVRKMDPWPQNELPIPRRRPDFDPSRLTWVLDTTGRSVELDLTPRLWHLAATPSGPIEGSGKRYGAHEVDFSKSPYDGVLDIQALYVEALEYKRARGYTNLHISPQAVEEVVRKRCRLRLLGEDRTPSRLQQATAQAVKAYIDRFVRMKERESESQNAEPAYLQADDPQVLDEYRIQVKREEPLKQIEELFRRGLRAQEDGGVLPRLYFDRSLFNPLLCEGGKKWKQDVSIHPPALNRYEQQLLRDLRWFWERRRSDPQLQHYELYVLRNLAQRGIRLFHRSPFYPDFILWLRNVKHGVTRVIFVDPHGVHHDGLSKTEDKFEALRALKNLSQRPEFKSRGVVLVGYLLVPTASSEIPDAGGKTEAELEAEYPLIFMREDREYVQKILKG